MEFLKKLFSFLLIVSIAFTSKAFSHEKTLSFLAHKGHSKEALFQYEELVKKTGKHAPELLKELCWKCIEESLEGFQVKKLPLAIMGALIADDERSLPYFRRAATSNEPIIALLGIHGLFASSKKEAVAYIEKVVASDFLPLQLEAIYLLTRLDPKKALRHIEALFYKLPEELLVIVAELLYPIDLKESTSFLKKLLVHKRISVRLAGAHLAAKKNQEALIPYLKNMLSRFDPKEKEAALFALQSMQDTDSLPAFREALKSSHRFLSLAARRAIENLGESLPLSEEGQDPFFLASTEKGHEKTLKRALESDKLVLKANAALAFLKRRVLTKEALNLLVSKKYAFEKKFSPARTLFCWQPIPFETSLSVAFRSEILALTFFLDDEQLNLVGDLLIQLKDSEILPLFIRRIVEERTDLAKIFLNKYIHTPGDPFLRGWSLYGLASLGEEGKMKDLAKWTREVAKEVLLDPETILSIEGNLASRELFQEDKKTWLFFSSLEILAEEGDLDTLLYCLLSCHPLNAPVIAGILIQATL